ncbi:MAG: uroporphyrinogen-III synthase [Paracoccaceae bacterium]|nr:uroporphyrinogen-III synthase [Paracoccaceae bacterium]MDG2259797.1 uroporphyrinogen-III synthase [Paracoccaceae bacterium]
MRDARPILLLTRPLSGSERFAGAVKDMLGDAIEVVISPLQEIEWLEIEATDDEVAAVIFTSQNGVLGWNRVDNGFTGTAYCVGPQTAEMASQLGLVAIDCGGNADAVVDVVSKANLNGSVIHYRGEHGLGDVVQRLRDYGVNCQECVVYRQKALLPDPAFFTALASERPVLAALFSPRSAALFGEHVSTDAAIWLAVISPNVAERVDLMLQRRMMVADAPNAGAMLDLVKEFLNKVGSGCDGDRA